MAAKGAQTRKKIIDRSLQLFSVKGYYNTSVADILAATGLTKGGLYGHFRSKEDIWYAVYDEAVRIWRSMVFKRVREVEDPVERIELALENDMRYYIGDEVFDGGCFFLNMLVELSGQSTSMSKHVLRGFVRFARLIRSWLEEAEEAGLLKDGLNFEEISNFIVITLSGASALYAAIRNESIWKQTCNQLRYYISQLRK